MKTFAILIVLMMIVAAIAQLMLPWWSVALVAAIFTAYGATRPSQALLIGSLGIGGLWLLAVLWLHVPSDGVMAGRVAGTLGFESSLWMYAFTFIAGGLSGGLGGICGYYFKSTVTDFTEHPEIDEKEVSS